jgi:hypothetical protein
MTTQALHSAAITYANVMVQLHEIQAACGNSELPADKAACRAAYNALYDAHYELNKLAEIAANL